MYLKKLELHGFKSFPERIALDFDNVIAAVVGPNGSGKSNIADAIRWALGEQSVKSLRGQKWEDVIFSGTQNRRALGFAEVSMTLDNSGKELNAEYTDVTVTRKVYRSGESEYLINGRAVRLKDVRELFMDTGIGKEGYSIIGQGRIDEILNARSEERRLIFEEASGIVKFKTRKQEAFAKLDAEKKNLIRVDDILTEIESNLGPLFEQQEKAKRFIELSERLKLIEINLFMVEEIRLKDEIDKLTEFSLNNTERLRQKEAEKSKAMQLKESLKKETDELSAFIKELREEIFTVRANQEKHKNDIKINDANIVHFQTDTQRLKKEIDGFKENKDDNNKVMLLLEARKSRELIGLSTSKKLLDETTKELERLNELLHVSEAEMEQYKNDIVENIRQASEIKSALTRLKSLYEHAGGRNEIITDAKLSITSQIRQKKSIIKALESKIMAYEDKHRELTQKRNELNNGKESLTSGKVGLQEAYDAVSKELIKNKERFKVLNVMAMEHEGFYRSVKEVLKAAGTGMLTGVCGAVGDMLSVLKEHEVAIEVALGASIQNIVTDDENAAKRAIEFLKRNKYGRATFLPITTVKTGSKIDRNVLNHPGVVGTAKSLTKYDGKYEKVVSALLERVIIVDNMQNALDFSKKTGYNFRVVTLQGELLNTQGAITGGSVNERVTNVFSRNRELLEIEAKIGELYKDREATQNDIKSLDSEILGIKTALDAVYKEIEEILLAKNTAEQKHENELKELNDANEQAVVNEQELTQIKEQLKELTGSISAKEAELREAEERSVDIEGRISERQTVNQSEKQLRDTKLAESANLRVEVSEANGALEAIKADIERLARENAQYDLKVSEHLNQIEKTDEKIQQAVVHIKELEKGAQMLEELCAGCESKIVLNETEKLKKEEAALQTEEELYKLVLDINGLSGENIRLEAKREKMEEDRNRLFNDMWENYEITLKEAKKYEILEEPLIKLQKSSKELKNEIRLLGSVNVSAIEQYKETKERFEFLTAQRSDIISAEKKLREIIDELTGLMEKTFIEQFEIISKNFNEVFKDMFGGGTAYLALAEKDKPLESGIEIAAELPGKKVQNISLLSGGERALTAIALLFGILKLKPSPFCVLDEIEAALDDANIGRFVSYLKKMNENTQFIIITHRKGTMEAANALYGVTMEEKGVSKLISLNFETAVS